MASSSAGQAFADSCAAVVAEQAAAGIHSFVAVEALVGTDDEVDLPGGDSRTLRSVAVVGYIAWTAALVAVVTDYDEIDGASEALSAALTAGLRHNSVGHGIVAASEADRRVAYGAS